METLGKVVYQGAIMMVILRRVLSSITLLVLAACASPPPPALDQVPLAPGVTLALPAPAELGRNMDAAQLVTARHGDDIFVFEGRLSVTADSLTLVGTDPMGRRAMTLRWNGATLEVERAPWLPDSVHPQNILADIVLLYWPEASLRRHLSGAEIMQDGQGRHIRRHDADVIAIRYQGEPWSGVAQLSNLAWKYDIEVRSTVIAP